MQYLFQNQVFGMVNEWVMEFFPFFFLNLPMNEAPKLIWLAWLTHLGAENMSSFKL